MENTENTQSTENAESKENEKKEAFKVSPKLIGEIRKGDLDVEPLRGMTAEEVEAYFISANTIHIRQIRKHTGFMYGMLVFNLIVEILAGLVWMIALLENA